MSAASAFSSSPWFIDPARIVHIRKIGDGGFAEVYESTLDGDTSNLVAAKHAKGIVTLVGSGLRRFTTEVDMIYKLNHPNIVKTRGACLGKRQNMLIMDLHPGSLRDVIDLANSGEPSAPPPLPWQDRVRILAQLADGIKYLHENKIIHRDLKAANVLVSDDLQPKIADFGFAHTKTSSTQTSVRPGQTVGTTAWMAPEVFNGCFSNTTDVWGLACIAIELITYDDSPFMGRFPSGEQLVSYLKDGTGDVDFGAKSWAVASSDLAAGKHNCSINDPSAGCPPTLVKILATCFDRDYNNRPSAAAVAKSLHALLAGLNPIHSTRCMDSFYAPSLPAAACRSVVDALVDKRNAYAESAIPDAGASHMDFTLASASLGDKSRAIVMAAGEQAQREKAARTAEKQRADALEKRLKELQLDREKEEEARRKRDKEEEERRRKEREEEEAARKKRLQEEEEARERRNKEDEERRRKDREEDERRQREFRERERRLNEEALAARRAAESASYSSYTPSYSSYTPSYSYAPAPAPAPAPAAPRSSGGVFSGSYHSSSGSANGRALYTGPRGGTYYHTASGGRKYV